MDFSRLIRFWAVSPLRRAGFLVSCLFFCLRQGLARLCFVARKGFFVLQGGDAIVLFEEKDKFGAIKEAAPVAGLGDGGTVLEKAGGVGQPPLFEIFGGRHLQTAFKVALKGGDADVGRLCHLLHRKGRGEIFMDEGKGRAHKGGFALGVDLGDLGCVDQMEKAKESVQGFVLGRVGLAHGVTKLHHFL